MPGGSVINYVIRKEDVINILTDAYYELLNNEYTVKFTFLQETIHTCIEYVLNIQIVKPSD